jgi:hypothetical protein
LEEQNLEALCAFCESMALDLFGAVTYTDAYASKHGIYSPRMACKDIRRGLREFGYRGRFALAAEFHRTGREVPHVHLLLESHCQSPKKACEDVWQYFSTTRGRTRIEPILGLRGTRYALKDVLKQAMEHPGALDLCSTRAKRKRKR